MATPQKRLELPGTAQSVHFQRMEVPQHQNDGAAQDVVASGQGAVLHRHNNVDVGGLLHQLNPGCSTASEPREALVFGRSPEEGHDVDVREFGIPGCVARFHLVPSGASIGHLHDKVSVHRPSVVHAFRSVVDGHINMGVDYVLGSCNKKKGVYLTVAIVAKIRKSVYWESNKILNII